MLDIECVVDAKALLGESTYWDTQAQCLWWLDIYGQAIHRYAPVTHCTQTFRTPSRPGCLAVRERGGLVLAMGARFVFFDPTTGVFEGIADIEAGRTDRRMNDGKTDRQGRFWSGSMFEAEGKEPRPIGSLYRLDTDLSCHRTARGFTCFNGLSWSPDSRTMYFTDSAKPYVWACEFDRDGGHLGPPWVFIDLSAESGVCDGATIDAEGAYWFSEPHKGKIHRYDPEGTLMRSIDLPVDTPTCCEFGGRNLDILYITTATLNRSPSQLKSQPWAGGLLAIDVGVKGLPASAFSG